MLNSSILNLLLALHVLLSLAVAVPTSRRYDCWTVLCHKDDEGKSVRPGATVILPSPQTEDQVKHLLSRHGPLALAVAAARSDFTVPFYQILLDEAERAGISLNMDQGMEVAVQHGRYRLVHLWLNRFYEPHKASSRELLGNLFVEAAAHDQVDTMAELQLHHPSDMAHLRAWQEACDQGRVHAVLFLVQSNLVAVDERDNYCMTVAVVNNYVELAHRLRLLGAATPPDLLSVASKKGFERIVKVLTSPPPSFGSTSLPNSHSSMWSSQTASNVVQSERQRRYSDSSVNARLANEERHLVSSSF